MNVLLIIAHGSRRTEARREIEGLATRVAELAGASIDRVELGFLEFDEPDIPTSLDRAAAGAEAVYVLPFFLNAGIHVARHLPELVAETQARHPHIRFKLLPHLGSLPALANLIADSLRDTQT